MLRSERLQASLDYLVSRATISTDEAGDNVSITIPITTWRVFLTNLNYEKGGRLCAE